MSVRQEKIDVALAELPPDEARETLRAIMVGEVDALVVESSGGPAVYTLRDANHPYRIIIERMSEGAVVLGDDATVLYCNRSFCRLLGADKGDLLGRPLQDCVAPEHHQRLAGLLALARSSPAAAEMELAGSPAAIPVNLSASPIDIDDWNSCVALVVTDLTARRRSETTAAAEEFVRSVLDQAAEPIIVCDAEGIVSHASLAAQSLCTVTPLGRPYEQAFPLELAEPGGETRPLARGERLQGVEVQMAGRGGEIRHFLARERMLKDAGGATTGRIVILADITERKRAEERIRESEARFRSTFEQAAVGIAHVAIDGRWLRVNEKLCATVGYTREELLRMNCQDIIHPDDLAASYLSAARLLGGSIPSYAAEERYLHRDGFPLWINSTVSLVRTAAGRPDYFIVVAEDIHRRKEAEFALEEERQTFRNLTHIASDYFWELDERYRFTRISESLSVRSGLDVNSFISRKQWELPFVGVSEEARSAHRATLEAQRPFRNLQVGMINLAGEERWFSISGDPIFSNAGQFKGYRGAAQDITERNREAALLRQAKAEAQQANNAKSRFLAAASHDLRQPLSALTLYTDALLKRVSPTDRVLVGNLKECLGSLNELLTDLLDLSKLDAGVVTPNVSTFALDDMLSNLVSIHAPEAKVKGLRLRRVATTVNVATDPVLLRRMLGNFVANAVRYTERGSVLIGCRRRAGGLWVEVWDTGIGIPADQTAAVFEEFKQLDEARQRGSGLGLAIAAKTAALLGLQIRVRSELGRGSMFAVEVPLCETLSHDVAPQVPTIAALRIGLVEDNAHVRQALTFALSANGHEVVAAASGEELTLRLGDRGPDVVVSDYRLSGSETGFDAIASIRKIFGEELPAVLITGDTDPHLLRSMSARGIVVQHKPLQIDVLQSCIAGLAGAGPARERPQP